MAITPTAGDVTLGMVLSTAPSLSAYDPPTTFSAAGWFYTGSSATEKGFFYMGEDETLFGSGSYVWLGVDASQTLTLKVFDGSTLFTYTGNVLAADTWYEWIYVRGDGSNSHKVYVDIHGAPGFFGTLRINQTKADNFANVESMFWFMPAGTAICNVRAWMVSLDSFTAKFDLYSWGTINNTSAFNIKHLSRLRFPNDLYNYGPIGANPTGFTDTSLPGRTHLTNIGSNPVEFFADPPNLKTQVCGTFVESFPFTEIVDSVGTVSNPASVAFPGSVSLGGQPGSGIGSGGTFTAGVARLTGAWTSHIEHQMDPSTAGGYPIGAIVQSISQAFTAGHFLPGDQQGEYFSAISITGNWGDPGTWAWLLSSSGGPDPTNFGYEFFVSASTTTDYSVATFVDNGDGTYSVVGGVAWNSLTAVEARSRIFSRYFGRFRYWDPGLVIGSVSTTQTHKERDMGLFISYTLPADWEYTPPEPEPEVGNAGCPSDDFPIGTNIASSGCPADDFPVS